MEKKHRSNPPLSDEERYRMQQELDEAARKAVIDIFRREGFKPLVSHVRYDRSFIVTCSSLPESFTMRAALERAGVETASAPEVGAFRVEAQSARKMIGGG